jgi:hypothetical protein
MTRLRWIRSVGLATLTGAGLVNGAIAETSDGHAGAVRALIASTQEYAASSHEAYKWNHAETASVASKSVAKTKRQGGFTWSDVGTAVAVQESGAVASYTEAEGEPASSTGYRWGIRSDANQAGYRWGIRSVADQAGYRWGIRSDADQAGYRWGIRSDADQAGYRWGIRSDADQAGYRWGIRSDADQAGYRWGIRSDADQAGYRWGIRSGADQAGYRWGIR